MKQSRKKKRKAQTLSSKKDDDENGVVVVGPTPTNDENVEENVVISNLVEAFSLASIEEAKAAYREANGDPNKAAEILSGSSDYSEVGQSSCSSSTMSFGLDSSSTEGFNDSSTGSDDINMRDFKGGNRGKKVVAATGTVSSFLAKDYVSSCTRKEPVKQQRGLGGGKIVVEEAEQFLCSMLGNDCELSMGVVRDVLCSCEYDVEKALEVLLDLSGSSCERQNDNLFSYSSSKDPRGMEAIDNNFWQPYDRGFDSTSQSSDSEGQDCLPLLDVTYRNYAEALLSSDSSRKVSATSSRTDSLNLSEQVLESLFNVPKSSERDPASMNWRTVVKQMESFAQKRAELCPSGPLVPSLNSPAKGAEYHAFRETSRKQWDNMKSCYQKAAAAYSSGEKNYASYMSDQGQLYGKMARDADEKASMEIFKARNKDIENVLTIDLHGQHVKPAMRLVKLHLLFGTFISSVQFLRIITGCGSNGLGKSMLKESVLNLVKKERLQWREENRGTVLIKLDGAREFSFLDSGSDSDCE